MKDLLFIYFIAFKEIIKEADANGDGLVDFEEFAKIMTSK